MDQYPKRSVVTSSGRYSLSLTFLGIFDKFIYGAAQAGNIKGIIELKVDNNKVELGSTVFPANLDREGISVKLCNLLHAVNPGLVFDTDQVDTLYKSALCEIKKGR